MINLNFKSFFLSKIFIILFLSTIFNIKSFGSRKRVVYVDDLDEKSRSKLKIVSSLNASEAPENNSSKETNINNSSKETDTKDINDNSKSSNINVNDNSKSSNNTDELNIDSDLEKNRIKYDIDPVIQSMGGISSTYEDPIGANINFSNPAANFNLDSILFTNNLQYNNMFISFDKNEDGKNNTNVVSDVSKNNVSDNANVVKDGNNNVVSDVSKNNVSDNANVVKDGNNNVVSDVSKNNVSDNANVVKDGNNNVVSDVSKNNVSDNANVVKDGNNNVVSDVSKNNVSDNANVVKDGNNNVVSDVSKNNVSDNANVVKDGNNNVVSDVSKNNVSDNANIVKDGNNNVVSDVSKNNVSDNNKKNNTTNTTTKTAKKYKSKSQLYISNISLGFPIKDKFVFVFGYQPYTVNVLSKYIKNNNLHFLTKQLINKFIETNGLNVFHFISAFKVDDNWKLGIKNSFIYGDIEIETQDDKVKSSKIENIKGLNTTFGSIYKINNISIGRYKINNISIGSTYSIENFYKRKFTLYPSNFNLGIGYGDNNWQLSCQYNWKKFNKVDDKYTIDNSDISNNKSTSVNGNNGTVNSSNLTTISKDTSGNSNTSENIDNNNGVNDENKDNDENDENKDNNKENKEKSKIIYNNLNKFSLGGYFLSKNKIFTYRGGIYYEDAPFTILKDNSKDRKINYGANIGLGVTLKNSINNSTHINIGFTFGEKRNYKKFILRNKYTKFYIGVNTGIDI